MIGNLKYEEIESISLELEKCASNIKDIIKDDDLQNLVEFTTTVDAYSKYLRTSIELYKDADKVLQDLK